MIAEFGHFALIIALAMALLQSVVPMVGSFKGYSAWMRLASSLSYGQLLFVAIVGIGRVGRLTVRGFWIFQNRDKAFALNMLWSFEAGEFAEGGVDVDQLSEGCGLAFS